MMIEATVRAFGSPDMAFITAGLPWPVGDITAETAKDYDRAMEANLRGPSACTKHALLPMTQQGKAAIVNRLNLGGLVGQAGWAACHSIIHGVVLTAMSSGMTCEILSNIMCDQPITPFGRSEEIAAAVLWPCWLAASFVSGALCRSTGALRCIGAPLGAVWLGSGATW